MARGMGGLDDLLSESDGTVPLYSYEVGTGDQAYRTRGSVGVPPGVYDTEAAEDGNGQIDTTVHSRRWQDGLGTSLYANSTVFPSLAGDAGRADREADAYVRGLAKMHRDYAERASMSDPYAGASALADVDSLKSGYRGLVASGWSRKDAAHAVGLAGSVFGGYSNLENNAGYLAGLARDRGTSIQSVASEMSSHRKEYGANYLTALGVQGQVGESSFHHDAISDGFSEIIGAMRSVEDQYNWRFDRGTYSSVMRSAARMAGDLASVGMSVRDVGADGIVRAALADSGALSGGGTANNPVVMLSMLRKSDENNITLFGQPGLPDSMSNPSSATRSGNTTQDYGLATAVRQAVFSHRARSVRNGLSPDNFDDPTQLRSDLVRYFRMFSTSSSKVTDDAFGTLADVFISACRDGRPASVTGCVADASQTGLLSPADAESLAKWSRSVVFDDPAGNSRMQEAAMPFLTSLAGMSGKSMKDPEMLSASAALYRALRKRLIDRTVVADLEGMEKEALGLGSFWMGSNSAGDSVVNRPMSDIYSSVQEDFAPFVAAMERSAQTKMQMAMEMARRKKMGSKAGDEAE